MRKETKAINGVLLLDKPAGLSSNKVLQQIKHKLHAQKAGHTGTLDPMATGMLPICFGEATKVAQYLLSDSKTYEFTLKLGEKTDSGDADGEVVISEAVPLLEPDVIERVLSSLTGPQQQTPPMYSAIKQNGQPLYKLARKGVVVERAARDITITKLELLEISETELTCVCSCTTGTYIRVLAEDIAVKLGTVGHLIKLRRTHLSVFEQDQIYTPDDIDVGKYNVIPIAELDLGLREIQVSSEVANRLVNGQRVLTSDLQVAITETLSDCMVSDEGGILGIGEVTMSQNENLLLKLKRRIHR